MTHTRIRLTVSKTLPWAFAHSSSPQCCWIHENLTAGSTTVDMLVYSHAALMMLTHGKDIYHVTIHLVIIFLRPFQTFINPSCEMRTCSGQVLPCNHKQFKGWNSTSKTRQSLAWHSLLNHMWNLCRYIVVMHSEDIECYYIPPILSHSQIRLSIVHLTSCALQSPFDSVRRGSGQWPLTVCEWLSRWSKWENSQVS